MRGILHHIELNVSDLKKSRSFWTFLLEFFGYHIYQEWDDGISWKLGSTYIVLVQTRDEYLLTDYHRSRTGLNHLAFHAESRDEVDRLTYELRKRNINILYEDRHPYAGGPNYYAVFFEDPDRIKIEAAVTDRKGD